MSDTLLKNGDNFMSRIDDARIECTNILIETTIGEYLEIARKIIGNNELQRRRVRSSKSIYSLLKEDLKRGCVIPPLVLAVTETDTIDFSIEKKSELVKYMKDNTENVIILDGLQRTHTIIAAEEEIKNENMSNEIEKYKSYKVRLEVYLGITKFGILYRMLTLNTGQTPMSTRHQIEMLYGNTVGKNVEGIELISETEGRALKSCTQFKFNDAIDGFTSYMQRNEFPIDRQELLEYIKTLHNLSGEDHSKDLFNEFIKAYSKTLIKFKEQINNKTVSVDDFNDLFEYNFKGDLYGMDSKGKTEIVNIFNSPQAICGFGAALGIMKKFDKISSIENIVERIESIPIDTENDNDWILLLLIKLDMLRTAKKIGNAQRMFFKFFFYQFLDKDSQGYLNFESAIEGGFEKYRQETYISSSD